MLKAGQRAVDRCRIKERRGEAQTSVQAGLGLPQHQVPLKLRSVEAQTGRLQLETGQGHGAGGSVLEREGNLEHRVARQVASRLDQLYKPLEGVVLVSIAAQGRLPHLRHQLAKGEVLAQFDPQDEGVDEEADQRLDLLLVAVGDGRAHHQIALPREPREQQRKGGEDDHKRRGVLGPSQRVHRPRQLRRAAPWDLVTGEALSRRSWAVGRQFQHGWNTADLTSPVLSLPV